MNSKIIAAGVVVALCAVALIGVGYAYTATVTSPNNSFSSNYIVVQVGDGADTLFTGDQIEYTTETTGNNKVVYTTVEGSWTSDKEIKVTNPRGLSLGSVTVTVEISKASLGDYLKLFYVSDADSVKAQLGSSSEVAAKGDASRIYWTFENVPVGSNVVLKINYFGNKDFEGTLTSGPGDITVGMKITATANATAPTGITIAQNAATITFSKGGVFSSEGLKINATYSDSGSKDVTQFVTISSPDMSTAGQKTVTITYQGYSVSYDITVSESS